MTDPSSKNWKAPGFPVLSTPIHLPMRVGDVVPVFVVPEEHDRKFSKKSDNNSSRYRALRIEETPFGVQICMDNNDHIDHLTRFSTDVKY